MLEKTFSFPFKDEEAYQLSLPICDTWSSAKKKILIVMQTVDSRDLKAGGMLADKSTRKCFTNVLKFTRGIINTYNPVASQSTAYAVVNFNAKRHLHLSKSTRTQIESDFAKRISRVCAKLKPTHILVSGDDAMSALFPSVDKHNYKRGWVHNLSIGDLPVKVTSTLDFSRLLEKQGEFANLLGFFCRHFTYLHLGKHPHNLSHVKSVPIHVNTILKFKQLMAKLKAGTVIAVDTETKNLSVLHNRLYTVQFAFAEDPTTGYVLDVLHPMSKWSKKESDYIIKCLTNFFGSTDNLKELVFFNGMYDLRVLRRELKLPIIWHKVWEITAGEHDLDENIVDLASFGAKPGNLAAIYCSYGNDFYYNKNTKFSKEDRNNCGNTRPDDPGFLMYASTDVVSLLHMRAEQIKMASHQFIEDKVYKPYFVRHMKYQMSDTAHQLSHLREDGSLIDAKYLRFLTSKQSPLITEMSALANTLKSYDATQQANSTIIKASGLKSKGLFGKLTHLWALSFSKPTHLQTLFFDTLKLEPVSETANGTPSVDKAFVAHYADTNPIVSEYGEYTKLSKLLSTYARGWFKKLISNNDSITDSHLRPDYSFFDVATGRLASKNPSLQTIPSRGKLVKIIKQMFIAPKGYMLVRFDYSAHEVRVWSIASFDKVLAAAFKAGQKLRQSFIQNPSDENKKAIKEKGDIHILNVLRFFKKLVDKEHPLRDAVKAVVFGVLYGKSAETLGNDTKASDIGTLKEKIRATHNRIMELEKQ